MAAAPSAFFKTERTASEIKSELLPRAFEIFVTILLLSQSDQPSKPALCADLLTGLDGHEPTPAAVKWLQQLYRSSNSRLDLNKETQTILYAADKSGLAELQDKVEQLPFLQDLVFPPVMLYEDADQLELQQLQEAESPAIIFLDPTNEGLSQQVLFHAIQAGSPSLLMLFSPKDLERTVKRARADSLFQKIFGERLDEIKSFNKQHRSADRRESFLMESFRNVFQSNGLYTLDFKIYFPKMKETSYYFMLASRSTQVYIKVKELLEGYSDLQEDGVPLFGANMQQQQTALFHEHYKYSIVNLVQELSLQAPDFNNRTMQYVYENHSIGNHYTLQNYRLAFEKLMRLGKVRFINPKTGQPISKPTPSSLIRYK